MKRSLALYIISCLLASTLISPASVDPCKRQPFRGRCPADENGVQSRSQFVLRYYLRNGECVSYPYGHCATDESEPQLYLYKDACSQACLSPTQNKDTSVGKENERRLHEAAKTTTTASNVESEDQTYGTVAPSILTECEKQRKQVTTNFKLECDEDGNFKALQCDASKEECFCVNAAGKEVAYSRSQPDGVAPECAKISLAGPATTNECVGAPAFGPCKANLVRWYYNEVDRVCRSFKYSGCGGQGNVYENELSCVDRCVQSRHQTSQEVEQPTQSKTKSVADCNLPKERGPCDKYELKFYYKQETKTCAYFFYGGCEGNGNAFDKIEDCESFCSAIPSKEQPPIPPLRVESNKDIVVSTTIEQVAQTTAPVPIKFELPSTTESPVPLDANPCLHPKDSGSCKGRFVRWFWNNNSKMCEAFTYTGCGGSGNNWSNREQCLSRCHTLAVPKEEVAAPNGGNICMQEVDVGECSGTFPRFAFDKATKQCRPFVYGGCGGNANNFGSTLQCEQKSRQQVPTPAHVPHVASPCDSPIEIGDCDGVFPRFAYDKNTNQCRQFTYGGCGGNGNNFASMEACSVCQKPNCPQIQSCDFNRCQLVNDVKGCAFCSCPPIVPQIVSPPFPMEHANRQLNCPIVNLDKCLEPCMIFSNRKGCKECVCPAAPTDQVPSATNAPTTRLAQEITRTIPHDRHIPQPRPIPHLQPRPQLEPRPTSPEPVQTPNLRTDQELQTTPELSTTQRIEPTPPTTPPHVGFQPRIIPQRPSEPVEARAPGLNSAPPGTMRPFVDNNVDQTRPIIPQPSFKDITGEKCTLPLDPGPCNNFMERWYFDSSRLICQPFQFGGCGGNHNSYITRRDCEVHCARFAIEHQETAQGRIQPPAPPAKPNVHEEDSCTLPLDSGHCFDYVQKWYFNAESGLCDQFPYGSCGGNSNRFDSKLACEQRCVTAIAPKVQTLPTQCLFDRDEGFGNEYHPIYYFNSKNLRCEQMVYKGKGGNANFFPNLRNCLEICTNKAVTQTAPVEPIKPIRLPQFPKLGIKPINPITVGGAKNAESTDQYGNVGSPAPFSPLGTATTDSIPNVASTLESYSNFNGVQRNDTKETAANTVPPINVSPPVSTNGAYPTSSLTQATSTLPVEVATVTVPVQVVATHILPVDTGYQIETSSTAAPTAPTTSRIQTVDLTVVPSNHEESTEETTVPTGPVSPTNNVQISETTRHEVVETTQYVVPVTEAPKSVDSGYEEVTKNVAPQTIVEQTKVSVTNVPEQTVTNVPEQTVTNVPEQPYVPQTSPPTQAPQTSAPVENVVTNAELTYGETQPTTFQTSPPIISSEAPVVQTTAQTSAPIVESVSTASTGAPTPAPTAASIVQTNPTVPVEAHTESSEENHTAAPQTKYETAVSEEKQSKSVESSSEGRLVEGNSVGKDDALNKYQSLDVEKVVQQQTPAENLPVVGPSVTGGLNYASVPRANGVSTFSDSATKIEDMDMIDSKQPIHKIQTPTCPNKKTPLSYGNGQLLQCLPGKKACPEKASCIFNGINYFCCPNNEDPYDQHVFGGYDGEETRNGYKQSPLNIRSLRDNSPISRAKRQALGLGNIHQSIRFDGSPVKQIARANRLKVNGNMLHICTLEVARGNCAESHLRYFYDVRLAQCRQFYFSGCGANGNSFATQSDCERLCKLPEEVTTPEPTDVSKMCLNGKAPFGGLVPLSCGSVSDSIGCPVGYECQSTGPQVCCPVEMSSGEKLALNDNENIRFAPKLESNNLLKAPKTMSHFIKTPQFMCPDGSDALKDLLTGKALDCGTGVDGHSMCPVGYYCAMDTTFMNNRLCCPFGMFGTKFVAPSKVSPFLNQRKYNLGEVISKPSLPVSKEVITATPRTSHPLTTSTEDSAPGNAPIERMMLKTDGNRAANTHAKIIDENPSLIVDKNREGGMIVEDDSSSIHTVEELPLPLKKPFADKSSCHIRPSEGRACREDEPAPRTNLQYFYSTRDSKCKLFFFRGCGANSNRFETKKECEKLCMSD